MSRVEKSDVVRDYQHRPPQLINLEPISQISTIVRRRSLVVAASHTYAVFNEIVGYLPIEISRICILLVNIHGQDSELRTPAVSASSIQQVTKLLIKATATSRPSSSESVSVSAGT